MGSIFRKPSITAAYVVRREVMFSQACLFRWGIPHLHPIISLSHNTSIGPMSFLGVPLSQTQIGVYPSPRHGGTPGQVRMGQPPPSQGWGNPPPPQAGYAMTRYTAGGTPLAVSRRRTVLCWLSMRKASSLGFHHTHLGILLLFSFPSSFVKQKVILCKWSQQTILK